ncbi:hypothetical protein [Pseudomonas protegens]|uniref:hypothetical protein n=1 Tax=Pseudomonas protegens TaxID=380021 RepID=UPI00383A6C33
MRHELIPQFSFEFHGKDGVLGHERSPQKVMKKHKPFQYPFWLEADQQDAWPG